MAKQIKTVSDLIPDAANANKGTERGRYAVEASLRETGAGRSIVVDREGRIIAGNKTLEAWADISGEIEIVKTDGKKLIVVQREDLDLSDVEGLARKLAYYDNRAGQLGLEWDAEQLFSDLNAGVDLSGMFFDDEIADILATIDGYEKETAIKDENYSRKIESPQYEPKNEKPPTSALFDDTRTRELLAEIDAAEGLTDEEKQFLRVAAHRHTVLYFNKIADFYAHSGKAMQALMENSALVIIDFDKAIELGYVRLTQKIADMVKDEYGE